MAEALTGELRRLAALQLAGARIRQARWNPGAHVFELLLRREDAERGAVDTLLRYRGVQLLEPALPELAAVVEDVARSVAESRVSGAGGRAEHRVVLAPEGSIVIRFGAVEITETLAPSGEYGETGFRFQVLSC